MDQDAGKEKEPGEALEPGTVAAGEEQPQKPHPEYEIDIFKEWCKSCGICAAFCPKQCIRLDEEGGPVVESSQRCSGCRWCELHCPDFAICVKELKSRSQEGEED